MIIIRPADAAPSLGRSLLIWGHDHSYIARPILLIDRGMGNVHNPVNNDSTEIHYSPVNEEGATKRGLICRVDNGFSRNFQISRLHQPVNNGFQYCHNPP